MQEALEKSSAQNGAAAGQAYGENTGKGRITVSKGMFLKGMGAGMAVAAAVGFCIMPKKPKLSRRAAKLLKLAGGALDGFGAALGF